MDFLAASFIQGANFSGFQTRNETTWWMKMQNDVILSIHVILQKTPQSSSDSSDSDEKSEKKKPLAAKVEAKNEAKKPEEAVKVAEKVLAVGFWRLKKIQWESGPGNWGIPSEGEKVPLLVIIFTMWNVSSYFRIQPMFIKCAEKLLNSPSKIQSSMVMWIHEWDRIAFFNWFFEFFSWLLWEAKLKGFL